MDYEIATTFVFMALLIAFTTLGCVLLSFFWLRHLSRAARALLVTAGGALVLLVPVCLIGGVGAEAVWVLLGGSLGYAVIGYPIAFLATRKLDRLVSGISRDIGSVFE
jgi:hypothetical protein